MKGSEKIDEYVAKFADWRGELLGRIRALVHAAEPGVEEQWKWNSPVFAYGGKMFCSASAFKKHVSVNFFDGADLDDPEGIFDTSTAKRMRTVKYLKAEDFDEAPLKDMLKRAVPKG